VILPAIVRQHIEEGAVLAGTRDALTVAPHINLRDLRVRDRRLAAHLDGILVAADEAWSLCMETVSELPYSGTFVAGVRALDERHSSRLCELLVIATSTPAARDGLFAAMGWSAREQLQGFVARLLMSEDHSSRVMGIAACALHRVDPGLAAAHRLADSHPLVRRCAIAAAGELGRSELMRECASAIEDSDPDCQFWAARSTVLLGDRDRGLDVLKRIAVTPSPDRARALALTLQASELAASQSMLRELAEDASQIRWVIKGGGILGDPAVVPWIIRHMSDPDTARVAGEAFATITGLDLFQGFEVARPEGFESGPSEDPNDENVAMDPDEGLPFPDVEKIQAWWDKNSHRFQPGTRYFMGAPVTREHCIDVLKNGYQRQRILAAHYLCLLDPGTPLFNTSAPAWRQQKLLAQMS